MNPRSFILKIYAKKNYAIVKNEIKSGGYVKIFLILIVCAVIFTGCATKSPDRIQSEKEMAIWNDPTIPADTKNEILRAMYLDRISKHETVHDPSEYRPVVDPRICSDCNYNKDLAACSNLARESQNYSGNLIAGAAAGAGIGAALAAVSGLDIGVITAGGATGGAIGGLGREAIAYRQVISRCMQGRGYNVLR